MNKETEPRPLPLPIEQVARIARETLLRNGNHIPTLIAEGNGVIVVEFPHFGSTAKERQEQMTQAGYLLAREGAIGLLEQAFFIAEGWMSVTQKDEKPQMRPSEDPDRKEVLTISRLELAEQHLSMVVFEMIRDQEGRLTNLKTCETTQDNEDYRAESPLLEAFIFGFAMGLLNDAGPC